MMPIDLEAQLRSFGQTLDSHTSPVSAREVSALSRAHDGSNVLELGDPVELHASENHRRWLLLTAAAAVLVIGMIGSIVVFGRSPNPSTPADSDDDQPATSPAVESTSTPPQSAPTTVAVTEPAALEVTITPAETGRPRPDMFPIIQDPNVQDSFGKYNGLQTDQTPFVTSLVARVDGDRLSEGIRIRLSAEPRDLSWLGDREIVTVDGTDIEVYGNGETPTVILPGEPAVEVSGRDPVSFLQQTGLGVLSFDPTNPLENATINESALPAGYQTIVQPESEPIDALSATTATSLANSDGPSVSVSLANPLASFAIHSVLEQTEVGGIAGWAAPTPGGYTIIWPISESTWAEARVRGGTDESLGLAEAVAFAAAVDFVDETEWRAAYRVAEPWFGESDSFIEIDRGRTDGIEVGMLVESDGRPIGQVARVTDSASDVLPVSHPDFSIHATVADANSDGSAPECRVRGGNDHVGYVCDRPFNEQEMVGAEVVATGNTPMITEGTSFGTITSIIDNDGESVALLDLFAEFPIAGDTAIVVIPTT
jgi:rod shape-determining protein MreC